MHYPGSRSDTPNAASTPRARRLPTVALRAAAVATFLLLAACGGHAPVRGNPPPARHWATNAPADPAAANAVLMRALSLVGTPYRWGGDTPEGGFDRCEQRVMLPEVGGP